mmetsp:Transcript_87023/g.127271  ORF Transcript_87023/g.127271 Transcript_87023/m.127271 type:complete len:99 (-) Transcript_87023:540-836(-)
MRVHAGMCVARVRAHACMCMLFVRMRARACALMRVRAGACMSAWSGSRVSGRRRACARALVCVLHAGARASMRICTCMYGCVRVHEFMNTLIYAYMRA